MSVEKNIRDRVDSFVAELTQLIREAALERVSEALGGGAPARARRTVVVTTRRKGTARVAKGRGRRKGQKRSAAQMAKQISAIRDAVRQSAGIRADQIAKQLGVETRDLALPIKKLLADKTLTKKGQKRATSYYIGKK